MIGLESIPVDVYLNATYIHYGIYCRCKRFCEVRDIEAAATLMHPHGPPAGATIVVAFNLNPATIQKVAAAQASFHRHLGGTM
jgi:hypothetical protein